MNKLHGVLSHQEREIWVWSERLQRKKKLSSELRRLNLQSQVFLSLHSREILACQEGLRGKHASVYQSKTQVFPAMLSKVQSIQKEVDKLVSGNETLQMYIDNLTVQMAKRR